MTETMTIFSCNGKTYVGILCTNISDGDIPVFAGLDRSIDNVWVVKCPCELEFELVEVAGASSRLEFKKVMPIFATKLTTTNNPDNIYFAFPKDSVILSTVTGTNISGNIEKAYKQMTNIS